MLNRGDILKQLLDMPPDALTDREKALNALLKNFRKISLQMHPDRIAGKSEDEKKRITELFKEVTNVKASLEEALKNGSSAQGQILKTLGVCRTAYEASDPESKAKLQTVFKTAGFDDRFFKTGFIDPPPGTPQQTHTQGPSFRERSATGPGLNEEDDKFFSNINREQSEDFLKTRSQGNFIIRPSSKGSQFVVGSIRLSDTKIIHFLFEKRGNQFYRENNKPLQGSISDFLRNEFRHEMAKQVREVASPSTLKNFRGELNKNEVKDAQNQLKRGEYFINVAENGSVMMYMRGFDGELEAHRLNFKENYLIEPDISRYLEKSRKNFAEGKYRHIDPSEASAYLKDKQIGDFVLTRAKEDDKTIIATMKLGENQFLQQRFSLNRGQLQHQTSDNKLMIVRTISAFMEKLFVDNLAKQEVALGKRHIRKDILNKPKVDEKLTQMMRSKVNVALNKILTSRDRKGPKRNDKPVTPPGNRRR